ncbi:Glucose-1-phosphate adenylyltransferase [Candidatus Zixiibacteriota bacterium]|nr:Glucose-1-phosphate adenylyltransferase [candidate division Zixibacteria bacterium]
MSRSRKITQAVILAGGEGRRLLPYTKVLPKPLWPVGGLPIVEVLLRQLSAAGIKEVILAVGYQAEMIRMIIGDGRQFGLKVRYAYEEKPLGTAGPLKKIRGLDSDFLVLNGDLLTDLPFKKFIESHFKLGRMATVAVFKRTVKVDFGVVVEKNRKIIDYREKPVLGYSVSMGIYAFRREVLKYIPDRRFDFPDIVHKLIKVDENPAVFDFGGRWLDIGRPDDWERADRLFEKKPQLFLP